MKKQRRRKPVVFLILSMFFSMVGNVSLVHGEEAEPSPSSVPYQAEQTIDDASAGRTITVSVSAEAGVLPDDAVLAVQPITQGTDQYNEVEDQLAKDAENNDKELIGFLAYDISFKVMDEEVEPNGIVNVSMQWNDAASPIDTDTTDAEISVKHIKEETAENTDEVQSTVVDLTNSTAEVQSTEENAVTSAEISTDSFSVFTITWTTTKGSSSYRFANVRLHYVTDKGLTISDPTTVPELSSYGEDGILKLSDWANNSEGNSRVEGYVYVEARIGDKDGQVITGLKGVKSTSETDGKETYQLYYTTDNQVGADSNWHVYTDSVSGTNDNNANVFLIYNVMNLPITVHYVDTEGIPLKNSDGTEITKDFDVSSLNETNSQNHFTDMSDSNNGFGIPINGYSFKTTVNTGSNSFIYAGTTDPNADWMFNKTKTGTYSGNDATFQKAIGSIKGATFRFIRYDAGNNRILVARSGGNDPYSVTDKSNNYVNFSIYITYPIADTLTVTIHRVDSSGNKIAEDISKSVSSNNNTVAVNDAGNLSGYMQPQMHYENYKGYSFSTMNYAKDSVRWTSTVDSVSTQNLVTEVWAVYDSDNSLPITIHHVDQAGRMIAPDTSRIISASDTAVITSENEILDGYSKRSMYYGYTNPNKNGTEISSMTYRFADSKWTSTAKINDETSGSETTTLQTELWIEYSRANENQIVIHYVNLNGMPIANSRLLTDSNGNPVTLESSNYDGKWDGYTIDASYKASPIDEYTYTKEFIGDITIADNEVPARNKVMYHYDSTNEWQTGKGTGTSESTFTKLYNSLVTDIYHVYRNTSISKDFTVHYSYITKDNTEGTTDNPNQRFTLTTGGSQDLLPKDPVNGTTDNPYVPTNVTKDNGKTKLTYMATRLGSIQGPDIHGVEVTDDGDIKYHYEQNYVLPKQRGADRWYYSAASGRNFTMTLTDGNYILNDSQHGSLPLNLTQNSSGDGKWGEDRDRVWTAVYHGENETTKYTVTVGSENNGRRLVVEDWLPNINTNIYVIYLDDNTDTNADGKLWIEDDLKYSGYFMVGMSDALTKVVGNEFQWTDGKPVTQTTNVRYTWYRRNGNGEWQEVTRKQDYQHYNIEYDSNRRTWLDVEADMGSDVWKSGDQIQYKVKVTYTQSKVKTYELDGNNNITSVTTENSKEKSVESEPISVQYYGQLENGSFEKPNTQNSENTITVNGRQVQVFTGSQASNSNYKAAGGVWQTTGLGSTTNHTDKDIEVYNVNQTGGIAQFWYDETKQEGFKTENDSAGRHANAAEGEQIAEINCEAPGALYQDVITHPNEQLSYWFSHRARMNSVNDRGFDSLYLVIMPTKLAMTSASDGGELKTQTDLKNFIASHGGYDEQTATAPENRVTYRDEDNGILIRKVSSNPTSWHKINETADYIAQGGLTRFFFATGKAHLGETMGNFLDDVGFSQSPSTPEGFSLTIQKTFSNLTQAQVASMQESFKVVLSDQHINSMTGAIDNGAANAALNDAVLGFNVSNNGGIYTFTPTAKQGETDLLTGRSRANARIINGNVVMTWTLDDQKLDANDQYYNYKAVESGASIDDYRLSERKILSPAAIADPDAVTIHQNESGRITINNTYTPYSEIEQTSLTVRKLFAGVTPRQVDSLFSNGYRINISGNGKNYDLSTNTDQMDGSIMLDESRNTDGSTVLKWTIPGMLAGTYKVTESGLEANQNDNKLTSVTVNGESIIIPTDLTNVTELQKENLTAGNSDNLEGVFEYKNNSNPNSITTNQSTYTLNDGTNIIIARYAIPETGGTTTGENESAENQNTIYRYLVWTSDTLGLKSSKAVKNKIKSLWNLNALPEDDDILFRSGKNPGRMTITTSGGVKLHASYDSYNHLLAFSAAQGDLSDSGIVWDQYYSDSYTVNNSLSKTYGWEDDADITIENLYNPIVKIQKVSTDGTALGDAQFRLYKLNNDSKQYYQNSSTTAKPNWGNIAEAKIFTTASQTVDSSTLGMIEIGALEKASGNTPDIYYLEEIKAPDGYNKLAKPISFTVDQEGTIELNSNDANADNTRAFVDYQTDARYYVIRIQNTPGVILPKTGGIGTYPFFLTGLAGILSAGFLYLKQRRK